MNRYVELHQASATVYHGHGKVVLVLNTYCSQQLLLQQLQLSKALNKIICLCLLQPGDRKDLKGTWWES